VKREKFHKRTEFLLLCQPSPNCNLRPVETAGSLLEQLLPKSIHAVTSQGFELKVALFVIASSLNGYLNL
jgi:hypothetical protein